MKALLTIASRNILRNRRRSLMTGSAVAAGALATLLFGGYASYIFAGLETGNVQRVGHLTVFRSGYFLFGSGNPAAYGIDHYQEVVTLIREDSVLSPLVNVLTPTQSLMASPETSRATTTHQKPSSASGSSPPTVTACVAG